MFKPDSKNMRLIFFTFNASDFLSDHLLPPIFFNVQLIQLCFRTLLRERETKNTRRQSTDILSRLVALVESALLEIVQNAPHVEDNLLRKLELRQLRGSTNLSTHIKQVRRFVSKTPRDKSERRNLACSSLHQSPDTQCQIVIDNTQILFKDLVDGVDHLLSEGTFCVFLHHINWLIGWNHRWLIEWNHHWLIEWNHRWLIEWNDFFFRDQSKDDARTYSKETR